MPSYGDCEGHPIACAVQRRRFPAGVSPDRAYKHWPEVFNNDSTLTSALLDRLLHHAETVIIEGKSFRTKDQIES